MTTVAAKPAVFLDRDGTIVDDPGYLSDPEQVRLLDGAAGAIWRLKQAGYEIVVVTNQSGVARGMMTEAQVQAVNEQMCELLSAEGAVVDAVYYCPYLEGPEATVEAYRRASNLRKPAPGMLLQAAQDRDLNLSRSWMIGNSRRDVQAGAAAGCRTILVSNGSPLPMEERVAADRVAADLTDAAVYILEEDGMTTPTAPPELKLSRERDETPREVARPQVEARAVKRLDELPRAAVDSNGAAEKRGAADSAVLAQILEEVRTMRRERRHREFSFAHLLGAVSQAFSVCALGWGIYCAMSKEMTNATISLLVAITFGVLALSGLSAGRRH